MGVRVALFDISADGLQKMAAELGPELSWTKEIDLADAAAITTAVAELTAAPDWGYPDILVNVAGCGARMKRHPAI